MTFVSLNEVLPQARKRKVAVPQFNINGFLWAETILEVAESTGYEVIIGVTDRNVARLGGYKYIHRVIQTMMEEWEITVPVVLHLDHGQSVESCKKAVDAGFSSVMFDGSHFSLSKNINETIKVCEYAQSKGVSVEGEIGAVGGTEDGITSGIAYADPAECVTFVQETGVDALAAALGSVHGPYQGEPNLQFDVMNILKQMLELPFVLHGASGIPDDQIRRTIQLAHAKINFNTELNQSWASALRREFEQDPTIYDPKELISSSKEGLKRIILEKFALLHSAQKVN